MNNSIRTLISTLIVCSSMNLSGCAYGLQGDQEQQYQLGLAAYEAGDMDTAVKWLKKAATHRDNRTPIFIPTGNGDFRIQMEETGLSEAGHVGAQRLLEEIEEASHSN